MNWTYHRNRSRNIYRKPYWTARRRSCDITVLGNDEQGYGFKIERDTVGAVILYSSLHDYSPNKELPVIGHTIPGPQEAAFQFIEEWLDKHLLTPKQHRELLKQQ